MKKILWMTAVLLALRGMGFAEPSQGQIGAGIMIGEPIGFTAKYWLEPRRALDLGIGDNDGLTVFANHLWHFPVGSKPKKEDAYKAYFGFGGQFTDDDDTKEGELGLRASAGMNLWASESIELFAELAPVFWLTKNDHTDLGGAAGVRFYFLPAKPRK